MPTNTKQSIIAAAGINERSLFDFALVARLVRAIEGRISPLEAQRESLDGAIDAVQRVGLSRINEVLGPAIESVLSIQERGFLIARSDTSATLADGNILSFFINDLDERALFTPSPFTALTREDNAADYAVARTIAYDPSNGEFICQVVSFFGDAGPHSDWVIGALAGSTAAQYALLGEGQTIRDVVVAARDVSFGHKDAAAGSAGAAAGSADVASEAAGVAAGAAQSAAASAEAAALFDPSGYASLSHDHGIGDVTDLEAALDALQPTSAKGAADGYAELDGEGKVPVGQLPESATEEATAAEIRALSGSAKMTPDGVAAALGVITPPGTSNWTPDWRTFIVANWTLSANRTLGTPTFGIPGTTRAVNINAVNYLDRTITFGSGYKGDLPDILVDDNEYVTLFIFCAAPGYFLVSDKAWEI
jgi:hypothetical protein